MIKSLTITQLVENTVLSPELLAEHGNSFLIEADGHYLLFDTGQGLTIRHNAGQLDVPVKSIESIVLSHGHYDHIGGLEEALDMTGSVDIYLHPEALANKFNRNGRNIGAPLADESKIRSLSREIIYTRKPTQIIDGIYVTGEIPRKHKIEDITGSFFTDQNQYHCDFLKDDQALYIETIQGIVVLLGCGHSGVINTLEYIRTLSSNKPVRAVIGGMHLLHANAERLAFTSNALKQMSIPYIAANHCTGINAICNFKNHLAESVQVSHVGSRHCF